MDENTDSYYPLWRECVPCEVKWKSRDDKSLCWNCGKPGKRASKGVNLQASMILPDHRYKGASGEAVHVPSAQQADAHA